MPSKGSDGGQAPNARACSIIDSNHFKFRS